MKYILALDQGTTSSRALIIDHTAMVKASAQKEFKQIFPKPGLVEHDPDEIWSSQASVITEVLIKAGLSSDAIVAIGITNQRETTVVWDRKSGKPLFNAIVWQDRRTSAFCQTLKQQGLEPLFQQRTGLVLDPYFSGTKLRWILDNVPGAKEKAHRGELAFGTVDAWLIWKLSGGKHHVTDITNASRTLLFNIHKKVWDEELLDILGIPSSLLPDVVSCSEHICNTHSPLFSSPLPICGLAGDQQAALFGQVCLEKGMAKATYGTGGFMLMNTGTEPVTSKNNLITTIGYTLGGEVHYALEGSVFIAGAVVQWLKNNLGLIKASKDVEALASSVPDTAGVFFVPAFTGLGAPYWDPEARGTIVGLTRGTQAAHLARAALQGIVFQVCDVLKAMESDANTTIQQLRVDGGAVRNNLLMQMQADLLGVNVIRPKMTELTALGAAFLAGLAIQFWKDPEEIKQFWQIDKTFEPAMPITLANKALEDWKHAVRCARAWEVK
ncbi:MAG: glycerol kinase GlpK [Simkania sp.]|nr:glycerol kinase GlpK [Simkania sp.]